MIDHISFKVLDLPKSVLFYQSALAPLGIVLLLSDEKWAGFGKNKSLIMFISSTNYQPNNFHLSFIAQSRSQVDQFYQNALANGGQDNGAPGLRQNYHPSYYAAYVFDPNGYNIEAVCHKE